MKPIDTTHINELVAAQSKIRELEKALRLFIKYAPLSGDIALMIRASQPGGEEAHRRANKLIEFYEHINEAHEEGRAALLHSQGVANP